MLTLEKRLILLSKFLKTTSFFWEKELLNQDITQLPDVFHQFALEFQKADDITMSNMPNTQPFEEIAELIDFPKFEDQSHQVEGLFLKLKKKHELTRIVSYLKDSPPKNLIDLCGGVGHLPQSISSINPELKSTTLDYDQALIDKARILNSDNPLSEFHQYDLRDHALTLNESTPFDSDNDYVFGLHTCGDLAEHAINLFMKSNSTHFMGWGCCYHKTPSHSPLSTVGQEHLPVLNKFALTLAAKCYKLHTSESIKRRYQVKKYRYALSLFMGNDPDFKTGSFHHRAYHQDFKFYIEYAIEKLNIKINIEKALHFYQQNNELIENMIALGFYRDHWGRILETSIILDRALYLQENGYKVEVLETFDRALSPRNLLISANLS